jgi:hypothetical protein
MNHANHKNNVVRTYPKLGLWQWKRRGIVLNMSKTPEEGGEATHE